MKVAVLCLALSITLAACAHGPEREAAGAETRGDAALAAAVAGEWRDPANVARDRYRHPRETLAFFGLRPDMTVIEIWPSTGWYTEILAPYLRDHGRYIGAVTQPARAGSAGAQASAEKQNAALRAKLAERPSVYGPAALLEFDPNAPVLGAPASADAVLTFRNVHNWVMAGNEAQMFEAFYEVLKPGGVLGVVDHRAAPGASLEQVKTSGYLPEETVVNLALKAGFQLQARSEINANPKDVKNYPGGVWTLPPRLAKGDENRAVYLAIGESDRMTLRFVKPAE